MRLFILGATGGTGRELVDQALRQGDQVTAFVRSPDKIVRSSPDLSVIKGDSLDTDALASALCGHDAVISALSSGTFGPTTFPQDAACSLIQAMPQASVRRLIVFSVAFLFPDVGFFGTLLGRLVFRNIIAGAGEMERVVRSSDLDWTIIRPPRLTNGPHRGRYRVQQDHLPRGGFSISRADVAAFALAETRQSAHLRQIVGVAR